MPNKPIQLNKWSLNSKGKSDKLKLVGALNYELNKKETLLTKVFPEWKNSIKERKYRENEVRYYIHIGRDLQRQIGAESDYFSAATPEQLVEKLYEAFTASASLTLSEAFNGYLKYRNEIGTNPKTIKEDFYTWNQHFRDCEIANKPVTEIHTSDIKNLFLTITADYKLTRTGFKNAKSLLNGIFEFCTDNELIECNPVANVDYKRFAKRFKPVNPEHDDYSREEIAALVQYFRDKEGSKHFGVYDYAVWFALNACMRIGEIKALKASDFKNGVYSVSKSVVSQQEVLFNEDGSVAWGKTKHIEAAPKGNASSGFRILPITDDIAHIVEVMKETYPENEYLFMNEGLQIQTKAFNRHLENACKALNITYRSSHKIRFSNCDGMFFDGGIEMKDMQSFMGHSTPSMTEHYFNRHFASEAGIETAREFLSVPKRNDEKSFPA